MTKAVKIGNVYIGDGNPVAIQSMTNLSVTDLEATVQQIARLKAAGCDIVRVAVPDMPSAVALGKVRLQTDIPLVADIHFDYKLAIAAMEQGADKIRINPGNIAQKNLVEVIAAAKAHRVPIRIGANVGSLNKTSLQNNPDKISALADSVKRYIDFFNDNNFDDLVLSVKSSDVSETVAASRAVAKFGYPLHLGVTEAGFGLQGVVKNSVGIGALLLDGIGDTIRVSLTDDPVEEVYAAKEILLVLNKTYGVRFVSCPKCGRCKVDLQGVAQEIYSYVRGKKANVKIAVMGCEVNGIGECSDADLGMAGSAAGFVFFKQGKVFRTVGADVAAEEFKKEIDKLTK